MTTANELPTRTKHCLVYRAGDIDAELPCLKKMLGSAMPIEVVILTEESAIDSAWGKLLGKDKFIILTIKARICSTVAITIIDDSFCFLSRHYTKKGKCKPVKKISYNSDLVMFDSFFKILTIKKTINLVKDLSIELSKDRISRINYPSGHSSKVFLDCYSDDLASVMFKRIQEPSNRSTKETADQLLLST